MSKEVVPENPHLSSASSVPSHELVQEIVEQLYPKSSEPFESLESCGLDNHLYTVVTRYGKKLLRISDASEAASSHRKELICATKAAEHGVATLRYEDHIVLDSWSCLTRDFFERAPAASILPSLVWKSLGCQASLVHTLSVNGFGYEVLLNQSNFLAATSEACREAELIGGVQDYLEFEVRPEHSWHTWLSNQLCDAASDESLMRASILTEREWEVSLKHIGSLVDWNYRPALCHGDLSPANILFGDSSEYQIIDWGNAIAHRVPHFDLAEISVWHDPSCWIDFFASGYGASASELKQMVDETVPLQLWRVLWAIRRDLERMQENWQSAPFAQRSVEKLSQLKLLLLS